MVPVASMSRLTAEGISTALSIGDEVIAVTVCFTDPEDEAADVSFRDRWEQWHPNVPLITLRSAHRSIAKPIVKYLSQLEAEDSYHKLVVLIPEVQPRRFWDYLLFNQRGVILDRAIRRGTANVVLCRLRYRLEQLAPRATPARPRRDAPAAAPPMTAAHRLGKRNRSRWQDACCPSARAEKRPRHPRVATARRSRDRAGCICPLTIADE